MIKRVDHCSCEDSFEPQTQPSYKEVNNNNYGQYNIPQGTWAVNNAFANPAVSDIFNKVIPSQHMPGLKSTVDPANIYAVNGIMSRLGSPSAYYRVK